VALGEGPSVQEQQMQMQLQQMQKLLQELMEESAKDKIALKGKDMMREIDSFNALTTRFKMLFETVNKTKQTQINAHAVPGGEGAQSAADAGVTTKELELLLAQAFRETFNVSLNQVEAAASPVLQQASTAGVGGSSGGLAGFIPGAPRPVEHVGADGRTYARDFSGSNAYRPVG
jgi:hypothetical protein